MNNINRVNAAVFAIVALLHVVRLLTGADAVIGSIVIPSWASVLAIVGASALAWWNLKYAQRLS